MNQTVLITGANRGLGLELVKVYLKDGFTVFAGVRSSNDHIERLKQEFPEKLIDIPMDVSSTESVENAANLLRNQTDHLDILINNAAVHLEEERKRLEQVDFDAVLETYNINTVGSLRVTKYFLPFVEAGNLKLHINISSEAGSIGKCWRDGEFGYTMSKAALNMQSVVLQNLVKPKGIKVLAIHPGWMRTDMGGPNATDSSTTSAEQVAALGKKYQGDLEAPIYFDNHGEVFPY
ncbi:SDR family oxidoreductase [Bacillus alkalicellulosilyticus]|uniref:SDR family oxidoreductase n=1 Tax=Alkalihalobacterium alkalicellulosilyticum TaxID=1912214 RepID=UPI000997BFCB|nr:SDR family oxidoreductase [Bacillus alkalicellulosilyticus]